MLEREASLESEKVRADPPRARFLSVAQGFGVQPRWLGSIAIMLVMPVQTSRQGLCIREHHMFKR